MLFARPTGSRASGARRATAALLLVVQLMVLLASLTELRVGPERPLRPGIGEPSARAIGVPTGFGGQQASHNEATCPACIVRSLHARVEVPTALPSAFVQQADPALPSLASPPSTSTFCSNLSRAPPIVG